MTAANAVVRRTWTREFLATLTLAWPLVVAQVAQNALVTTDVIMMGWLGPEFLAAGTLSSSFMTPLMLLGGGIVSAVAPMVAQALGAGRIREVRRSVRQGLWIAALIATALLPILWNIRPILILLGQDPDLLILSESYIRIAAFALYPALGTFALRSFLAALGTTRVILWTTLAAVALNALGNYAFMFGNFGMPALGLPGAALTTVAANCLMFGTLLTYALTRRRSRRFHILARFWKPDWSRFFDIFRIGTPIGLTIMAEVGMFSATTFLMGWLGTEAVAAHAVALQLSSLAFMVPLGIGMATTVRVGRAYGAGSATGVQMAGWTSYAAGVGAMALSAFAFLVFPHALVGIFLDPAIPENLNSFTLAISFLAIAALFQIVDGAQVVSTHALRGLSDTKIPMLIAFAGYWGIGVPACYVLGFLFGLGGVGIWLGLAIGLAVAATTLTIRFARRERLGLMRAMPAPSTRRRASAHY